MPKRLSVSDRYADEPASEVETKPTHWKEARNPISAADSIRTRDIERGPFPHRNYPAT